MMGHCSDPFWGSPLLSDNVWALWNGWRGPPGSFALHAPVSQAAWNCNNTPCLLTSSQLATCAHSAWEVMSPLFAWSTSTWVQDPNLLPTLPHLGSSQWWHLCSVRPLSAHSSVFDIKLWAHWGQEPCLILFTPSIWQGAWDKRTFKHMLNSFIHSFNKCLLSIYYGLDILLDARNIIMKKRTELLVLDIYNPAGEMDAQQIITQLP